MVIMLVLLIFIMTFAMIMGLFFSIFRRRVAISERLTLYTQEEEKSSLPPELSKAFKERVLLVLVEQLKHIPKKMIPRSKKDALDKKLLAAGNPNGMHADEFVVVKYLLLVVMIVLGLLLHNILYFLLLSLAGLFIPDLYLKAHVNKRRTLILQSMPDILDLLSVSVEAGLSFDAALQKVVEKYSGPLTLEFEQALQEINMGKPRREALRDMAERVNVDDVTTFLGSVIQADQLGVSITNVLKLQSQQVRANRRMRAEEKAQKAPIKILLPLVLFIFPTILIVLLGPAALQLMNTL